MLTIQPRPITDYVDALAARRPFAVSRWGDGEWSALLGRSGATCDGQVYSRALRKALTAILESRPTYDLQLGPMALRRFADDVEAWLTRRRLSFAWGDAGMFARASQDGTLMLVQQALQARTILLVGPSGLRRLDPDVLPIAKHIVIPDRNAFDSIDDLTIATVGAVSWCRDPGPVVAISAGPAAKVLVHHVSAAFPAATVIDFGSVWDPYAGRQTRTYHRAIMAREAATQ